MIITYIQFVRNRSNRVRGIREFTPSPKMDYDITTREGIYDYLQLNFNRLEVVRNRLTKVEGRTSCTFVIQRAPNNNNCYEETIISMIIVKSRTYFAPWVFFTIRKTLIVNLLNLKETRNYLIINDFEHSFGEVYITSISNQKMN